jgi:hypothetical protein
MQFLLGCMEVLSLFRIYAGNILSLHELYGLNTAHAAVYEDIGDLTMDQTD